MMPPSAAGPGGASADGTAPRGLLGAVVLPGGARPGDGESRCSGGAGGGGGSGEKWQGYEARE